MTGAGACADAFASVEADDAGAVTGAIGGALICEATGAAAPCTLVTIARAATDVRCGSGERSTSVKTTPAPAVAPIAVATSTMRTVRAKLGAGAG
jgi:hypothetical protein